MYEYPKKAFNDDDDGDAAAGHSESDDDVVELFSHRKRRRGNKRRDHQRHQTQTRDGGEDSDSLELDDVDLDSNVGAPAPSGVKLPQQGEIGATVRALLEDGDRTARVPYPTACSQRSKQDPKAELAARLLQCSIQGQQKLQQAQAAAEALADEQFLKQQNEIHQELQQKRMKQAQLDMERALKKQEEDRKLEELKLSLQPLSTPQTSLNAHQSITVNIRINGKHIRAWKIDVGDRMENMVKGFCARYDLSKEDARFEFDGERLNENESAQGLGLCDEDLIDVNIPQAKMEATLNERESEETVTVPSTYIVLKTRANSSHEHSWKIHKTDNLTKLVDGFCTKYGVTKEQVLFMFDGEQLNTHLTPQELGLEADDLIDVTILGAQSSIASVTGAENIDTSQNLQPATQSGSHSDNHNHNSSNQTSSSTSSNSGNISTCMTNNHSRTSTSTTSRLVLKFHLAVDKVVLGPTKRVLMQVFSDEQLQKVLVGLSNTLQIQLTSENTDLVLNGRNLDPSKTVTQNSISEFAVVDVFRKLSICLRRGSDQIDLKVFAHETVENVVSGVCRLLGLDKARVQLRIPGQDPLTNGSTLLAAGVENGCLVDVEQSAEIKVTMANRKLKFKVFTSAAPKAMMQSVASHFRQPVNELNFCINGGAVLDPELSFQSQGVDHGFEILVTTKRRRVEIIDLL